MLGTIPIKTTMPSGTPTAEGAFEASCGASHGNTLEITGVATVGSGSLYLLRYFGDVPAWRPWREYHKITADSSLLSGGFSGTYALPAGSSEYFCLYTPDSITATAQAVVRSY